MNPALISAGLQFAGGIFGGSKRSKAARQMRRDAITAADDAVNASMQDQQSLINYRNDDERRLREASGYDFVKLRADAQRGGFNPLTVLQATGAAGYDGRGAVLSTPFVSMGDAFRARADVFAGTGQAVTETAGYFGDALTGLGDSLMTLSREQQARQFDERMTRLQLQGRSAASNRTMTASPVKVTAPRSLSSIFGPDTQIPVYEIDGVTSYVSARNMDALGKRPFDVMLTDDWARVYGESADALGALRAPSIETNNPAWTFDFQDWVRGARDAISSPFDGGGGWSDTRKPLLIDIN